MARVRKSMELVAVGAFGAWGTRRAVGWLHGPPVRERVTPLPAPPRPSVL